LPSEEDFPQLRRDILQYNMHSRNHLENSNSRCYKDGNCIYGFPYRVNPVTYIKDNGRFEYRRRKEEDTWVVPHIPFLISAMQCHIHADICSRNGVFMYMYKYLFKGPDQCSFSMNNSNNDDVRKDEYKEYIRGRYLSSSEGAWRILDYNINTKIPSVKRIFVHLPGRNFGQMWRRNNTQSNASQLLRYFQRPIGVLFDNLTISDYYQDFDQKSAGHITSSEEIYWEIPYNSFDRQMVLKRKYGIITRLHIVDTRNKELFFLRQILTFRCGRSFEDLRTANNICHESYESAAIALGLLSGRNEAEETLKEASEAFLTPSQFRFLFTQLIVDLPISALNLWNSYSSYMIIDFEQDHDHENACNYALLQIAGFLHGRGSSLEQVGLPSVEIISEELDKENTAIDSEVLYYTREYAQYFLTLNNEQKKVFDSLISLVYPLSTLSNLSHIPQNLTFVTGKAGTGKSFLIKSVIAFLRSKGKIVLIVGSTALCVLQYSRGQTAHSLFKIPIHQVRWRRLITRHKTYTDK
jgi:PIF1-like helicase